MLRGAPGPAAHQARRLARILLLHLLETRTPFPDLPAGHLPGLEVPSRSAGTRNQTETPIGRTRKAPGEL